MFQNILQFSVTAVVLSLSFVFLPGLAEAGDFVPCEGAACGTCDLVEMGNRIIQWLITILFVIFAVLMTIAGLGLVTSGGNRTALETAKSRFTSALIGIIIVLVAWLMVDTILRGLLDGDKDNVVDGRIVGWGPWAEVQCTSQTIANEWSGDPDLDPAVRNGNETLACDTSPTGTGTPCPTVVASCEARGGTAALDATAGSVTCTGFPTGGPTGPQPATCSGSDCVSLAERGVPCKNPASCSISPDLADRIAAFHAAAGVDGARVTEGMPPTRNHRSPCHQDGTCVDYSKAGGMTPSEVARVVAAARANNLRPVYEVGTPSERQALIAGGVPEDAVKVIPGGHISAPHFSIYGR